MSTVPADVAAWTNWRFGHVSPGTEQNQRVHTANSFARVAMPGMAAGSQHHMIRRPSPGKWSTLGTNLNRMTTAMAARTVATTPKAMTPVTNPTMATTAIAAATDVMIV